MNNFNRRPGSTDAWSTPTQPIKLTEYDRYADAQQAVDQLSDDGFPMRDVTIVWSGLRQIEHVTGRRTIVTAARDGLLSGAWFGFIIGLLFSAFAEPTASELAIILTYVVAGALTVASFQAIRHWGQRGTRDFSTVGQLDAERFEIWIDAGSHARAQSILDITSVHPSDPLVDNQITDDQGVPQ